MGLLGRLARLVGIGDDDSASGTDERSTPEADGPPGGGPAGGGPAAARTKVDDPEPTPLADREGPGPDELAAQFAEQVSQRGVDLDFSPESLAALDAIVADVPESVYDEMGPGVTAYLGEVFVRTYDGAWTTDEEVGDVVDLSAVTEGATEHFAPAAATRRVMEGETTFRQVHDATVGRLDVDGPTLAGGPPGEPLDHERVTERRERATELADDHPEYELDFSPDSLSRLDDLIADEYDGTPEDVDRQERITATEPGTIPGDADLDLDAQDEDDDHLAAYLGAVFVQSYEGEWWDGDRGPAVSVPNDGGALTFEPAVMVAGARAGYVSFARFRDEVVAGGSG